MKEWASSAPSLCSRKQGTSLTGGLHPPTCSHWALCTSESSVTQLLGHQQCWFWPYLSGGWWPTLPHIRERGQSNCPLCDLLGSQVLGGVTFVKEQLSFSWHGGSSLSHHSFPICTPQRGSYYPKIPGDFIVWHPTFNQFPGPFQVLSEKAPTPNYLSAYGQRCWAASKKIGSSADSKLKSSQSMKSALITLHT